MRLCNVLCDTKLVICERKEMNLRCDDNKSNTNCSKNEL